MPDQCKHLDQIKIRQTSKKGCEDCLKTGDTWVHLRLCLSCGHVGCCESSGAHAKAHELSTKHAVIRQLPLRDASFTWCYECSE